MIYNMEGIKEMLMQHFDKITEPIEVSGFSVANVQEGYVDRILPNRKVEISDQSSTTVYDLKELYIEDIEGLLKYINFSPLNINN